MRISSIQSYIIVFIIVVFCSFMFRNKKIQAINWTYAYCSGAANLDLSLQWKVSKDEYAKVAKLSEEEYKAYRHQPSANVIINQYNNFGYVIIVFLARNIMFASGDLNAVIYFQILIHALIVLSIVSLLKSNTQKILFILLYGINPFIIHFVTFPFYYFWTVIPCYLFCVFYLKKKAATYSIVLITLLLYLSFLIRPTTIFVIAAVYIFQFLLAKGKQKLISVLGFIFFVGLTSLFDGKPANANKDESSFWHTAYIGFGAYPNKNGIEMSDAYIFDKYTAATNIHVSTDPITGTFQDIKEKNHYLSFVKNEYIPLLTSQKMTAVKNAFLNTIEAFGLGYIIKHRFLTILSLLFGAFMIGFIIYRKYYMLGICILCYAAAYTWFYPPIPAYNFGAFLPIFLVVLFFIDARLDYLKAKRAGAGMRRAV